jgi:hypothetical protein
VPLALANHSEIAGQFDAFTRQLIGPGESARDPQAEKKRPVFSMLGL